MCWFQSYLLDWVFWQHSMNEALHSALSSTGGTHWSPFFFDCIPNSQQLQQSYVIKLKLENKFLQIFVIFSILQSKNHNRIVRASRHIDCQLARDVCLARTRLFVYFVSNKSCKQIYTLTICQLIWKSRYTS